MPAAKKKTGRKPKGRETRTVNVQAMIEPTLASAFDKLRAKRAKEGKINDASSVIRGLIIREAEAAGVLKRDTLF